MALHLPRVPVPLSVITPNHATATNTIPERGNWGSKAEFVLSCIGMSVGMGNVWRFPYVAYTNGGAAFLVPYIILLLTVGKPMYFAECVLGQFSSLGPMSVFRCVPAMKGVGIAMGIVSLFVALYYNMFMAYSLLYFVFCFTPTLPWSGCLEWWGPNDNCYVRGETPDLPWCSKLEADGVFNVTVGVDCRNWESAGQQFWRIFIINAEDDTGFSNVGDFQWKPFLALFVSWLIVFISLARGIKTSGKIVYFTAIFPYVVLLILLIVGLTLDGAKEGLYYLFIPEWERLLDLTVWRKAAAQMFFSLNVAYGGVIMFSSYNKFTNKVKNDALIVSQLDTLTSIAASIMLFSIMGNMSYRMKVPIEEVTKSGPGLTFEVVPEALLILPLPQLWCALFFLMLVTLALDSEFAYVETFLTGIYDEIPLMRRHKVLNCLFLCMICCALGASFCTQGGMFILDFIDTFASGNAAMFLAIMEMVTVMWIYGMRKFLDDTEFMLGERPNYFWRFCWAVIDPFLLALMFLFTLIEFETKDYGGTPYPLWALILGWCLTLISMLQIPIWMAYRISADKKRGLAVRDSFRPAETWGPADPQVHAVYRTWKKSEPRPGTQKRSVPNFDGLFPASAADSTADARVAPTASLAIAADI